MNRLTKIAAGWIAEARASVAMEAALIFPVLAVMLVGLIDIGKGVLVNQKMVNASQVVSSIITRTDSVTRKEVDQTFRAAELVMLPFSDSMTIKIHVMSYAFDDDGDPILLWERKKGNWSIPNPEKRLDPLEEPNEGAVIVGVHTTYTPIFANSFVGEIYLEEVTIARGRQGPTVSCNNC